MFNYRLLMLIAGIINFVIPFATIIGENAIDEYQFTVIYFLIALFNVAVLTAQHRNMNGKIIILAIPVIILGSIMLHFGDTRYLLTLFGILYFSLSAFYLLALKTDSRLIYCSFIFVAVGTVLLLLAANPTGHNAFYIPVVERFYFYTGISQLMRDWIPHLQMLLGLVQVLFYFVLRKAQNADVLQKCDAVNAT